MITKEFDTPKPKNYQILANTSIAGLWYRKEAAIQFASSDNQGLYIVEEPDNPYDKNAIAVYGECSKGLLHLGYLPKELAQEIKDSQLFPLIFTRLTRIWIGDYGKQEIQLQLLIPKSKMNELRDKEDNSPPSTYLKEKAKFLKLDIKNKTTKEANLIINEYLANNPKEKAELMAYDSLVDQFSSLTSIEFSEEFGCKKPSKKLFVAALRQWRMDGKSLEELDQDYDTLEALILKISDPFDEDNKKIIVPTGNFNGQGEARKGRNGCLLRFIIFIVIVVILKIIL